MKTLFTLFTILSYSVILHAQSLPPNRAVDWSLAGIQSANKVQSTRVDFAAFREEHQLDNDDLALQKILDTHQEESLVIYFPAGTYHFSQSIHLGNQVVLQGASPEETTLTFDLGGAGHAIEIKGQRQSTEMDVIHGIHKEDRYIDLNTIKDLSVGDLIYLFEEDEELITSSWAKNTTGQLLLIESVLDEKKIQVKSPVRRNYTLDKNPRITIISPAHFSGVENLAIERLDQTVSQTSNIYFEYATNCYVRCVKSIRTNFAHVDVRYSTNLEISGGHFFDGFDHGGGGKAYGVMLQFGTGECLVTNNSFAHLRHSLILQAGANGNVLSYNHSVDPFWTGVLLPADSAGDLVLHGNYPYANLFEGNSVQQIVIDQSHGINGPENTFFRNRAANYGIFMNNNPASDGQNFIGNEITSQRALTGLYLLAGDGHYEYGNNHQGRVTPANTGTQLEASLYLESTPSFYQEHSSWPPIGLPNIIDEYLTEQELRHAKGLYTACTVAEVVTAVDKTPAEQTSFSIQPNPATKHVDVSIPKSEAVTQIRLMAMDGRNVYQGPLIQRFHLMDLPRGTYYITVFYSDGHLETKPFVLMSDH